MLRLAYIFFFLFPLAGCWTTRSVEEAGPCYCGILKPDAKKTEVCAVWKMNWNSDERQEVLDFEETKNCSLKDCQEKFSEKACTDYQAWLLPPPSPPTNEEPCFCDFVRVDHSKGEIACAIWKQGDKMLREYHFLAECNASACESKFNDSEGYCKNKFQPFYNAPDISKLVPLPLIKR